MTTPLHNPPEGSFTAPGSDDIGTIATRELATTFATAIQTGDGAVLRAVLSEHVAYQMPGRSRHAGTHHGRDTVLAKLTVPAAEETRLESADVTETIADGHRAFVTVALSGTTGKQPFSLEVGFHLQSDGEMIVGITEYSGDQYTIDGILGANGAVPQGATVDATRPRRWWHVRR